MSARRRDARGRAPATSKGSRARVLVAITALGLVAASAARASVCVVDGMFAEVSPANGSMAPRNVRVHVRLTRAPQGKTPPGQTHLQGPAWSGPLDSVAVSLRAANARDGDIVAADMTTLGMEQERIVEVVPREPLPRGRHFEVILTPPRGQPRRLGGFTVGVALDSTPPVWQGIASGRLAGQRPLPPPGAVGAIVVESSAERGHPWLAAEAPAASDSSGPGSTPAAAIVYGIWVAPTTGETIDYARPPLSYVFRRKGLILAGRDTAYPENDLCDLPLLSLPPEQSTWRVGIRAVDWAGNASAASEVTLNAGPPAPAPPPTKTP